MKKKIAAILTCFVMAAAFMPMFTYAADTQTGEEPAMAAPLHYVSLGDAGAAGVGMTPEAGYGIAAEGTYPALVSSALQQNGFDVTLDQMAMNGMRIEDLRYLLDDSYAGDAYMKDTFGDLSQYREEFRTAIADADLITCRLGMVDFGSYMIYLAGDVAKNCSDPEIKALITADPDGVLPAFEAALNAEKAKIPSGLRSAAQSAGYDIDALLDQYSGTYIEAAAYVYYSFCNNYEKSVQLIRAMNPDAAIVVLGLDNMLDDLAVRVKVIKDSFTVNIGALYSQQLIGRANARLAGISAATQNSAYVDCMNVERFLEEIAAYADSENNRNPETISQQFKDYCDIYEDDLLFANDKDEQLQAYKNNASMMEWGMTGAYDTAASSLSAVAKLSTLEVNYTTVMDLKDDPSKIANKAAELMAGLRATCWENALKAAPLRKIAYNATLKNYISSRLYGGSASSEQEIGRIMMAIGIRSQMGNGFFQQPSSIGHMQMSESIMNACKTLYVHKPDQELTCVLDGIQEYWQNIATGICYGDAAYTQVVNLADRIQRAPGHVFGEAVVTKAPEIGVDGESVQTCEKCGDTQVTVIPGLGPAGTKIIKKVPAKKGFTVKWKKPSKAALAKINGYEICYSMKSSMAGAKTVTVEKNSIVSTKIKKLKAKKKYFVQIRTFNTTDGKNYYSAWSKKVSVKTR